MLKPLKKKTAGLLNALPYLVYVSRHCQNEYGTTRRPQRAQAILRSVSSIEDIKLHSKHSHRRHFNRQHLVSTRCASGLPASDDINSLPKNPDSESQAPKIPQKGWRQDTTSNSAPPRTCRIYRRANLIWFRRCRFQWGGNISAGRLQSTSLLALAIRAVLWATSGKPASDVQKNEAWEEGKQIMKRVVQKSHQVQPTSTKPVP